QLRQFVIKLLTQPSAEKGEPFQQPLDIWVAPALPEEWRQRRIALGKTLAELAQGAEFALVVGVEGHFKRRSVRCRRLPSPHCHGCPLSPVRLPVCH